MPWRNGLYVRLQSWVARAAAGAPISPVEFDADENDEATALNNCVLRDGTGSPTADIPFAGHSLTGIRQAAAAGEPMEYAQAQALIAAAGGSVLNRLQNASFLVNQRGVSGTVSLGSGAYGHDRWKGGSGGCSYAFAQSGDDFQATISTGSLVQVILGVDVDGSTMTVSNAGTAQARIYPTGGTPPGFAACPVTATNLTPGQNVIVEFAPGTILRPQVEPGSTAHAFARRLLASDVIACQMLYEALSFDFGNYSNGLVLRQPLRYRMVKASVPTVTVTKTSDPFSSTVTTENSTTDGITICIQSSGNYAQVIATVTASCEP